MIESYVNKYGWYLGYTYMRPRYKNLFSATLNPEYSTNHSIESQDKLKISQFYYIELIFHEQENPWKHFTKENVKSLNDKYIERVLKLEVPKTGELS